MCNAMQVCTYQSQKFSVITFIGTHCITQNCHFWSPCPIYNIIYCEPFPLTLFISSLISPCLQTTKAQKTFSVVRLCWEINSETCSLTSRARSLQPVCGASVEVMETGRATGCSVADVDAVISCWWSSARNVALAWQIHPSVNDTEVRAKNEKILKLRKLTIK